LLCGFSQTYTQFLILRALFGIGMGGEWGVGASLAMENVPVKWRGVLSGILQSGYSIGYLLAAVAARVLQPQWGWRPMFWLGAVPVGQLSQKIGRRYSMLSAMTISLVVMPLWAFGGSLGVLAAGAFLMQVGVQGAWGIIPVHLNEMVPDSVRGLMPGLAYQLGILIASPVNSIQHALRDRVGSSWALAGFEIVTMALT